MDRQHESKQVGRRLLLNYIDVVTAENPTKPVITQVISFEPEVQYTLTFQDLSTIINRLAWWLDESLQGKAKGATIAYALYSPRCLRPLQVATNEVIAIWVQVMQGISFCL
jgi:acyl-coenzyme A synthetase/AMP-(fatty) acid ligase